MTKNKKLLGERLYAGQFGENSSEHLHRYALALEYCADKKVLDIACGDGYGSNMMAATANTVTGVDIDEATISEAKAKYSRSNLSFKTGSAADIPFADHSFDIVISFETLEHHDKHSEMMREIKRVLVPGGLCIVSTPDKLIYSDRKNYNNPFHVKELYKNEFEKLIADHFKNSRMYIQKFITGSLLLEPGYANGIKLRTLSGDFEKISLSEIEGEYLVAIASDEPVLASASSLFLDDRYTQHKIEQFMQSSLRYKIGKLVLSPFSMLKKITGNK